MEVISRKWPNVSDCTHDELVSLLSVLNIGQYPPAVVLNTVKKAIQAKQLSLHDLLEYFSAPLKPPINGNDRNPFESSQKRRKLTDQHHEIIIQFVSLLKLAIEAIHVPELGPDKVIDGIALAVDKVLAVIHTYFEFPPFAAATELVDGDLEPELSLRKSLQVIIFQLANMFSAPNTLSAILSKKQRDREWWLRTKQSLETLYDKAYTKLRERSDLHWVSHLFKPLWDSIQSLIIPDFMLYYAPTSYMILRQSNSQTRPVSMIYNAKPQLYGVQLWRYVMEASKDYQYSGLQLDYLIYEVVAGVQQRSDEEFIDILDNIRRARRADLFALLTSLWTAALRVDRDQQSQPMIYDISNTIRWYKARAFLLGRLPRLTKKLLKLEEGAEWFMLEDPSQLQDYTEMEKIVLNLLGRPDLHVRTKKANNDAMQEDGTEYTGEQTVSFSVLPDIIQVLERDELVRISELEKVESEDLKQYLSAASASKAQSDDLDSLLIEGHGMLKTEAEVTNIVGTLLSDTMPEEMLVESINQLSLSLKGAWQVQGMIVSTIVDILDVTKEVPTSSAMLNRVCDMLSSPLMLHIMHVYDAIEPILTSVLRLCAKHGCSRTSDSFVYFNAPFLLLLQILEVFQVRSNPSCERLLWRALDRALGDELKHEDPTYTMEMFIRHYMADSSDNSRHFENALDLMKTIYDPENRSEEKDAQIQRKVASPLSIIGQIGWILEQSFRIFTNTSIGLIPDSEIFQGSLVNFNSVLGFVCPLMFDWFGRELRTNVEEMENRQAFLNALTDTDGGLISRLSQQVADTVTIFNAKHAKNLAIAWPLLETRQVFSRGVGMMDLHPEGALVPEQARPWSINPEAPILEMFQILWSQGRYEPIRLPKILQLASISQGPSKVVRLVISSILNDMRANANVRVSFPRAIRACELGGHIIAACGLLTVSNFLETITGVFVPTLRTIAEGQAMAYLVLMTIVNTGLGALVAPSDAATAVTAQEVACISSWQRFLQSIIAISASFQSDNQPTQSPSGSATSSAASPTGTTSLALVEYMKDPSRAYALTIIQLGLAMRSLWKLADVVESPSGSTCVEALLKSALTNWQFTTACAGLFDFTQRSEQAEALRAFFV